MTAQVVSTSNPPSSVSDYIRNSDEGNTKSTKIDLNGPDFGIPPVDQESLIRQVSQSNTSPERTIKEYTENPLDNGAHRVDIEVEGKVNGEYIEVSGIRITDDGNGMSLTKFSRNFRGYAWYNEDTHGNTACYGKNCIGAKSGLDFFRYIDVSTTTNGKIEDFTTPEDPSDPVEAKLYEENIAVQKRYSKLKSGDDDTEIRKFRMQLLSTSVISPWETCDASEHGTTVYLHSPLPNRAVIVKIEELKRTFQTHFTWISEQLKWNDQNGETSKKRQRGMFLKIPGQVWEPIMPFDNGWASNLVTSSNPQGAYLLVTGSISKGLKVVYTPKGEIQDIPGKETIPPISLTADEKKQFNLDQGDVDVWLQLTYGLDTKHKQLLISISGSTVKLPWDLLEKISSGGGFSTAIRGKICSTNPILKDALRHNRTALDMGNIVVQKFWNYIYGSVFKVMAEFYSMYMQNECTASDHDVINEALSNVKFLFNGTTHDKGEHKFSKWICRSCGEKFQYKIGYKPPQCPACKCPDVDRYFPAVNPDPTHKRGNNPNVPGTPMYEIVPSLGNFIPLRYNPATEKFEIVISHPEFIQDVPKKTQWNILKRERIVYNALIAWSAYKLGDDGDDYLKEYGKQLKGNFLNNPKRKKMVEATWSTMEGLKPFVDKAASSFE